MDKNLEFKNQNRKKIAEMFKDKKLKETSEKWFLESYKHEYSYHFSWLGRPIIQYPQDMITIQEIIWDYKPDIIIETGIAHGGSLIFSASILELLGKGEVIGIDIDIREHNKKEIEKHPLYKRITMLEGSSINKKIRDKVFKLSKNKKVIIFLDSNHTEKHVLKELEFYSPLVTKGGYVVVFDTIIEDLPEKFVQNRDWGKNNNPKSAVNKFLKKNNKFKIDKNLEKKLLVTAAKDGYLKCIKN
jgi:cephalosporin hydroxylase